MKVSLSGALLALYSTVKEMESHVVLQTWSSSFLKCRALGYEHNLKVPVLMKSITECTQRVGESELSLPTDLLLST